MYIDYLSYLQYTFRQSMATYLLGLSALTIPLTYLYSSYKNRVYRQLPNQSIEQVIREMYLRITTKHNIATINRLYELPNQQPLLAPYQYTLKTGGKKIRVIMAAIISEMFMGRRVDGGIPEEALLVGGLIQYLHCASLIIDDIEDKSKLRRGKPCSYLVHGLDVSINAANLMYFLPFQRLLSSISSPEKQRKIIQIFADQMTLSHMGQAQDVLVHKLARKEDLPLVEEYEALTLAKTSSLLRMMGKMLCVLFNRSQQEMNILSQLMTYLGLAFQVTDDILNLTKNLGKGEIAEDLRQKKFTLIIHTMRENEEFMQMFIKEEKDEETINKMLEMILASNAVNFSKQIAGEYQKKAQDLLNQLQTPYTKQNFKKLMKFIILREN